MSYLNLKLLQSFYKQTCWFIKSQVLNFKEPLPYVFYLDFNTYGNNDEKKWEFLSSM